ncbi:MAG: RluA family pseudouridine synthase [Lentimicrobium sp.]|mgnify:CR=1 FL=1|jgi:23S rRNA pseudouridine1911/1915/1917 synthase|nr:RluA family pseudouridine synthase [Lentimicrobium sp.]MDD2526747.1 RluA family pseudouridine synthase [Lentimicrobiaceae bacterium]MDD4596471.1 RluA family pseudouridine synthase [Lentimicrobiaceae bacterium]MDY0024713.1 RluA family pseudouridine synthase [Lentimicrobium sp.]
MSDSELHEVPDFIDDENVENELYEHHRLVVDKGQGLLRIDKFLMLRIENASRNKIQQAAKAGNILVNNVAVKQNYRVKPLDVISVVLAFPPRDTTVYPQDIPLNIIYEDAYLLVVNKNAGMVVHPGYANFDGTMLNALVWHFRHQPGAKPDAMPLLVHRIDKDTSGIILVAKTEEAQSKLANEFFHHTIQRTYQAIVWGVPRESEGTVTGNVGRNLSNRLVMSVFPDGIHGKHAVTHYKLLRDFSYVSLVECKLETGRTHQIRAHMKYLGHPLFADERYGGMQILRGTSSGTYKRFVENCFELLPRQALHAKSLGFTHPITGEDMFFDSELPADMQQVLEKWENYISNRIS